MDVSVKYRFLPKSRSCRVAAVMDHFGVGFDQGEHVVADRVSIPIEPGDVVCFTGPSGSGKSSLMRAVAAQLSGVVLSDELPLPKRTLIDALGGSPEAGMATLTAYGLGEAQLMLRTPAELSDGQRYRFRLAYAASQLPRPAWIVADEFTAALDRTLARSVAYNLGRTARRSGTGWLLATTHTDVVDDLQPSLHVACRLEGPPIVTRRGVKKKTGASPTDYTSRLARKPIGPLFPGGIIGAIMWGLCGS